MLKKLIAAVVIPGVLGVLAGLAVAADDGPPPKDQPSPRDHASGPPALYPSAARDDEWGPPEGPRGLPPGPPGSEGHQRPGQPGMGRMRPPGGPGVMPAPAPGKWIPGSGRTFLPAIPASETNPANELGEFAGALASRFFGGEKDPEMSRLVKEEMELYHQTHDLAREYRNASTSQREEIKKELQKLVDHEFEVRQQHRQLGLKRFENELQRLRNSIERRNQARKQIVEKRVAELLGQEEDLGF